MKQQHSLPAQRGMTLIEILIAMVLGIFLLGGVIGIFINSKQTYRMQESLSRLQENSRFAVDFISRDIRQAGFFGCFRTTTGTIENNLNTPTNVAWDLSNPVTGFDNVAASFTTFANVVVGTDVIIVRGALGGSTPLVTPFTNAAQAFVAPSFDDDCTTPGCHIGEILMVADCDKASLFQATNTQVTGGKLNIVHSNSSFTPGNVSSTLTKTYGQGAEIVRIATYGYYIRQNASGINTLYRSRLDLTGTTVNLTAEEMIEGIEDMQILYGEDTNNDGSANYYVPAETTGLNMDQVVSVRINLLAQTINDNIASRTGINYTFNGTTTAAPDKRLRQVSTFTIALRNRLI